jgi:hypothetical protein
LKIKLKGCHVDTIEVIEAESHSWTHSQNMTSRMYLKNGKSSEKGASTWKGTTLRVMMASRPKISSWPDGSTSPGNYGYD